MISQEDVIMHGYKGLLMEFVSEQIGADLKPLFTDYRLALQMEDRVVLLQVKGVTAREKRAAVMAIEDFVGRVEGLSAGSKLDQGQVVNLTGTWRDARRENGGRHSISFAFNNEGDNGRQYGVCDYAYREGYFEEGLGYKSDVHVRLQYTYQDGVLTLSDSGGGILFQDSITAVDGMILLDFDGNMYNLERAW